MSDTLKKKKQKLDEKAVYAAGGESLKKQGKAIKQIKNEIQKSRKRKLQKQQRSTYKVEVNDISFTVRNVKTEQEALRKVSQSKVYKDKVNKIHSDEGVDLVIKVTEQ